jgi:hypothetical protein
MDEKITLEKLDALRERADISYQEAKELLELCNGDVVQALIELEHRPKETINSESFFANAGERSQEVLEKIKEMVADGKVTRIRVSHQDKVLLEIPVALGALGALFLPQLTLLAGIMTMFRQCSIELVKNDQADDDYSDDEEIVAQMDIDEDEKSDDTIHL